MLRAEGAIACFPATVHSKLKPLRRGPLHTNGRFAVLSAYSQSGSPSPLPLRCVRVLGAAQGILDDFERRRKALADELSAAQIELAAHQASSPPRALTIQGYLQPFCEKPDFPIFGVGENSNFCCLEYYCSARISRRTPVEEISAEAHTATAPTRSRGRGPCRHDVTTNPNRRRQAHATAYPRHGQGWTYFGLQF